MDTLSYGYKKPANNDTGDVALPGISTNAQLANDHNHDGSNSAPLAVRSVSAPSASWVSNGSGGYKQTIALPTGLTYDACQFWVRKANGAVLYSTINKLTSTTLELNHTNNTDTLTVFFR